MESHFLLFSLLSNDVYVSKFVQIGRELVETSCLFVLDADVNVLVELVHQAEELLDLLGLLVVGRFGGG